MAPTTAVPKSAADPKELKKTPTHPPVLTMVREAVRTLRNPNGSSLYAVKQFIEGKYPNLDIKSLNSEINDCVKGCMEAKIFVQTTGKGINGSFKLCEEARKPTTVSRNPRVYRFSSSESDDSEEDEKESEEEEEVQPVKSVAVTPEAKALLNSVGPTSEEFVPDIVVEADGTQAVSEASKKEAITRMAMQVDAWLAEC